MSHPGQTYHLPGKPPPPTPASIAQIRDAVQVYIERQDRPVRTWHVQDEIANRLDTRHALVYEALMRLEQAGTICKHVSPENGTEYWFSPGMGRIMGARPGREKNRRGGAGTIATRRAGAGMWHG